jgi:hypothetical protein
LNKKLHSLALLLTAGLVARPAAALRPFDGTDADVAPAGSFELELGALGLLREGRNRSLNAPAVVSNFGVGHDTELVIEGRLAHRLGCADSARTSLDDTAVSVKRVIRKGSLQEGGSGVSVAMECSVLLPATNGSDATGVGCAGIASQRFQQAAVHVNTALARTRERNMQRFIGVIVDGGSEDDAWHPIVETFIMHESTEGRTRSVLLGLVLKHSESVRFDAGLRRARSGSGAVTELRTGLTWTMPH